MFWFKVVGLGIRAKDPGTHCGMEGDKETSRGGAGGSIDREKIREVGGCQVVEGFVGEKEYFKVNTVAHGARIDLFSCSGAGVDSGCGVQNQLEVC